MMCENCGKKKATAHYKTMINGQIREAHLCGDCFEKLGGGLWQSPFGMEGLLSGLFSADGALKRPEEDDIIVCPKCKATVADIEKTGRVGCGECYNVFESLLTPYIKRIHGNLAYVGRAGAKRAKKDKTAPPPEKSRLELLEQELASAVAAQEYERAAVLRDEIKALREAKT